ncbi:MAG: mechanosensitive ion channel [Salinisphaeraceae bacterium]|nr:mechanosensitive ion channel [Salinisphaeraceae bacterium]
MGGTLRLIIITGIASLVSAGLWYFQPENLPLPEGWSMAVITKSLLILLGGLLVSGFAQFLHARLQAGKGHWGIVRRLLSADDDKPVYELFWLLGALHILIWAAIPVLLLRVWGLYDQSAKLLSTLASEGIKIGEKTHIVPSKILVGIFLFALLITATRWIKRRLNNRWLHHTPMHPGTREAVATMFGYITFIIALLIGLTFAGFNLSSLTIIAGALGVGIGFGLQNIANNFISGLILLFERPIRPGDFISVGETTGFVRKVSIRSTELETLDRMSVIVPNSDMLANHVQNWTLRDPFGRIIIPVGVAYGSDTELVKKILLDVAANNDDVIKAGHPFIPGPQVLFKGFGDSSLDFELRVFIRQVDKRLLITSAINFAIDAGFREHKVNSPFPQRDLWFRNAPPAAEGGEV